MRSMSRLCTYISIFILMLVLIAGYFTQPASADGGAPQLAYVAGAAGGISVIDIAQRRVIRTLSTTDMPRTVLLSPDGQDLYVAQPALGKVEVLIAQTGKVRCTVSLPGQPALLALSLNASVLYAAGEEDSSVRALNPTNCAIEQTFKTRENVYGLALSAATTENATPSTPNQLWITGRSSLTVFDVNGVHLGTIPVAGGPQNICIPGGLSAYVTTRQGSVVAIDLAGRKVMRTLLTGGDFGPMDYDATTGQVYVPDRQHKRLDILTPITAGVNVNTHEPARILQLDSAPQSIAITSDGQFGFVALANGQVLMLDIPGRNTVTSIPVGGTPHFIITGLYPPVNNPLPDTRRASPLQATTLFTSPLLLSILLILLGVIVTVTLLARWRRT